MPDIDETAVENAELTSPQTPPADQKFELDPAIMERAGIIGNSFWEMRDGEEYGHYMERVADKGTRDVMFLWHCYKRSGDDWLAAYRLAPRLSCLGALGANGWLDDMEEEYFDDISEMLPYDGIAVNLGEYEQQVAQSPFFAKYSADMADVLSRLVDQYPEQGPVWALETVFDEVRKRYAANRMIGRGYFDFLDATVNVPQGEGGDAPDGMVAFGIADVNEHWQPTAMIGISKQQAEGIAEAVDELLGEETPEKIEYPDDGLLEALLLQGYIWGERSWNKSEQIALEIAKGTVLYVRGMFGTPPDLGKMTQNERAARLEELAEHLKDDEGNIALKVDETKQPVHAATSIKYPLEPESAEFMELLGQQERYQKQEQLLAAAARYSDHLPACHDNMHALMLEEVLDCLTDVIGTDGFDAAIDDMDAYLEKRLSSLSAKAKSKWKKYLKATPDAAAAAKNNEPIVALDDEDNPIFASEVIAS